MYGAPAGCCKSKSYGRLRSTYIEVDVVGSGKGMDTAVLVGV